MKFTVEAAALFALLLLAFYFSVAVFMDTDEAPQAIVEAEISTPKTSAWTHTKRDTHINTLKAKCFKDKGYFRRFGDTAFCTRSLGHERTILWEKEV